MKRRTGICLILGLLGSQPLLADPAGPSEMSAMASELSVAPLNLVGMSALAAGDLVLVGLHASGGAAVAVIESSVDGSRQSVEVSAELLTHSAELIGQSLEVTAELAGSAIWAGSELILFIPDQILLSHHHRQRMD